MIDFLIILFIVVTSTSPKLYEVGIIISTFQGRKAEPQKSINLSRVTQPISGRFGIAVIGRTLEWQPGVLGQILMMIV